MSDIIMRKYSPSPHAVESRVGDETVILHLQSGTYFGLDLMGTHIWISLKEGVGFNAICETITDDYDTSLETVKDDLKQLVANLVEHDILVES